jgi:ATP-dependent RNA helicase DbpA
MKSFSSLPLTQALLNNLVSIGYEHMTPIQEQSLTVMLEGQDVIAQAKTGSGKTAAFGLALLNRLNVEKYVVQALVLCPTRELAEQVSHSLRQLARLIPNIKILNLSGGVPMKGQLDSLRHSPHIVVGTPGRVLKHIDKESLSLKKIQTLVLDEADRMLDMGFYEDINKVITLCPLQRQTLLFSATYPVEVRKIASKFLKNPKRIVVEENEVELDIQQIFYKVENQKNKFQLLKTLLLHHKPISMLIFCNTKEQTSQLAELLSYEGFSVTALTGDMEQVERDTAMIQFKNNSCSILVATDVAARGLDVKELTAVINYDLAFEHDVHIHRIGRTGRAGSKGLAISLTTPADAERICAIEYALASPITWSKTSDLKNTNNKIPQPEMVTLYLSAGKKDKIRPGDILGTLTKDLGLPADTIGKIDIGTIYSYVAIKTKQAEAAFQHFKNGKVKGRNINVRKLK